MLYFVNPTSAAVHEMRAGRLGFIDTPLQGNRRPAGVVWCGDNGCFNHKKFSEARWIRFLEKNVHDTANCVFATAPDVVGDAAATLERSRPWLPKIRSLGYLAAFVAQDGQENLPVPWEEFDVLFIGGAKKHPEWKLSPAARHLAVEAKRRGKQVHCGRINSGLRYRYWEGYADTCDGTYLTFGPDKNLPNLLRWMNQPALFRMVEDMP